MKRRIRPDDVSRWGRMIVAKRALVLIGVAGFCHLLVLTGLLPDSVGEQAQVVTVSAIDAIAAVGGIFWIQSGTTPADPKLQPTSTNGKPLVEAPLAVSATATGNVRRSSPPAELHAPPWPTDSPRRGVTSD